MRHKFGEEAEGDCINNIKKQEMKFIASKITLKSN